MVQTGWIGTGQDEAAGALDALTRALLEPPGVAEIRAEQVARAEREKLAADREDAAVVRAFLGRGGVAPGEVPVAPDGPDLEYRERYRKAQEILRSHGLQDLLPGAVGGGIFDANVGYLPSRSQVTADEALGRAMVARDRRERERRESAGVEAIARARQARPSSWGETMAGFMAGPELRRSRTA